MRVEAKHRETNWIIKGTLVPARKAMSKARREELGLDPRELVILEDKPMFPFYGKAYQLREMYYILKKEAEA